MICGSVLSRVESTTTFRLATPQLVTSAEEGDPAGPAPFGLGISAIPPTAATHAAEIGNGAMVVIFNMETPAWSTVEKPEF